VTAEKVGQERWVGSLKDTKAMAGSSLSSMHDWALKQSSHLVGPPF